MTDAERSLSDRHGHFVLPGVLDADRLRRLNAEGDAIASHLCITHVLEFGEAFYPLVDPPRGLPYAIEAIGLSHRLNHADLILAGVAAGRLYVVRRD